MSTTTTGFWVLIALAEVSGLTALILIGVLGGKHVKNPGYGWDGSLHTFNFHPLLMSLGFIFLYGNGAIAFRVIAATGINLARTTQKLIHFAFQASALIVACVALAAVFTYYDKQGYQDMFSTHSWVAIIAAALFTVQFVGGFFFFLFPKWGSDSLKTSMLSLHVFTGKLIFMMMMATALMGLAEVVIYDVTHPENFPAGVIVSNMYGLCILLFCGCIITILLRPQYQVSSLGKEKTIQMEVHDE